MFVKDFGLEHGNSVQTPATHDATEEQPEPEPLDQVQHSEYRSQVARRLFLSQDRADVTFIVNEICHRMSSPHTAGLCNIEEVSPIFETRKTMVASVQLWKMVE